MKVTDVVFGSLVVEMMALKSFVLGLTVPCSGHVCVFAGLISSVKSCVCCASHGCLGRKGSWLGGDKDTELSVDVSWGLAAGFVSLKEKRTATFNTVSTDKKLVAQMLTILMVVHDLQF